MEKTQRNCGCKIIGLINSSGGTALVRGNRHRKEGIQDQTLSRLRAAMTSTASHQLVICVKNEDYPASLEKRKIYEAIPDNAAKKHGQIRVIDESGEDYLYPQDYFIPVSLPKNVEEAVIKAA